jgi:biopolymer transport protein ExbB
MKKIFMFLAVAGLMTLSAQYASAQDGTTEVAPEVVEAVEVESVAEVAAEEAPVQEVAIHQALKTKFIEGGAGFMATVIACLILGLAIAIERIIYLNLASTNTEKLLKNVEKALNEGGVEAAKEVCRSTRGPVASIFYQGLLRMDEGVETVEKTITSYGSVQMGLLESGLSWITLFIAIAPMLGFMGTVIGMIQAFDQIQAAGDISPTLVAGGMKVALITTVGGLIAAIILQIFYNYLVSKVDSIVVSMEDASISLVDLLVKFQNK